MTWDAVYQLTRFSLSKTPPMSEPVMCISKCSKCHTEIVTEYRPVIRCSICGLLFKPEGKR